MSFISSNLIKLLLLAQDVDPAGGANGGAPNAGDPGSELLRIAPMLIMFVVLFYVIMIRPQQKEQHEREQRLGALKKNDKVLTIGGIIGTIVDLSNDGKRVTLKVDEGTRIKFTKSSIQGPYDESEGETADK